MLTFHPSADQHALELKRDGQFIGFFLFHPGKTARVVDWKGPGGHLSVDEMRQVVERHEAIVAESERVT